MSIEHRTRAVIFPDGEYKPTIKDKIIDLWDRVGYETLYCHSPAQNLEEHLQLPYSQRHKLGFWYTTPSFDFKDYRKQDEYFQKTYPIQYYIRTKILFKFTKGYVSNWIYENISCRISPKQKWLTKDVPNTWTDKVWLIPHINFKMVTHFVELEKCFDYTDYEASSEMHVKFAAELKECYDYIKNVRPSLEKKSNDALCDVKEDGSYEEKYGEVNRIEQEIEDLDTKWLTWIVVNRNFFWT